MIMDKLGKIFEDRRKKEVPVEVDRREKNNRKKVEKKITKKSK